MLKLKAFLFLWIGGIFFLPAAMGQDAIAIFKEYREICTKPVSMEVERTYWSDVRNAKPTQNETYTYLQSGSSYSMKSDQSWFLQDDESLLSMDLINKKVQLSHPQIVTTISGYGNLLTDSLLSFVEDLVVTDQKTRWNIQFSADLTDADTPVYFEIRIRKRDYELVGLVIQSDIYDEITQGVIENRCTTRLEINYSDIQRNPDFDEDTFDTGVIMNYEKSEARLCSDYSDFTLENLKYSWR